MTVQLIQGSTLGSELGSPHDARHAPQRMLAVAFIKSALERLRDRLRRAAELRAARKRRLRRLRALHQIDDRIFIDLAQARTELEFIYRKNLDLR